MADKKIFDLHNDVLTEKPQKTKKVLNSTEAVLAVWTTKLQNPSEYFEKASKASPLWAIEDLHFLIPSNLDIFKRLNPKPLYCSLSWNQENNLAGGAASEAGLKPLGKKVIKILEENGITLDLAHLNRKSFFEAAEYSSKPFICSHTCFNSVFNHKRNLDTLQIQTIINIGGIIGLTLVSEFMGKYQAGVADVIKQIEYFCGNFPINNLAVGSDFYGTKFPALKNYRQFNTLKNALVRLNYTQAQTDKIFYLNAKEFFVKTK